MEEENNFWGKIPNENLCKVKSPKRILEEQADNFNKISRSILCTIISSFEEPVLDWNSMNTPFEEEGQLEREYVVRMKLQVPSLDNYTILILTVKYQISQIYPCTIKNHLTNDSWEILENQDQFESKLKKILNSTEMLKLLGNLCSQLNDL